MGTDHLGRDILSRVIYGARISVTVGFLAVFVSGVAGTLIAMVSGVVKGWVDTVLMRLTDAFLSLPFLMVAVTVVSLLGPACERDSGDWPAALDDLCPHHPG